VVLPISLAMIFVVLYATLSSVRASLLILVNIPFALVGGMVSLAVSGEYLSVPASVGFIALLGIAVLNGLVMVSYFRQLREGGMPLAEAVREGAQRRLRPVLMTATIAAFGLVPLLFATGPGSEIQKPLAIVVIGGLVSSTLLTLILLPILYENSAKTAEAKPPREMPMRKPLLFALALVAQPAWPRPMRPRRGCRPKPMLPPRSMPPRRGAALRAPMPHAPRPGAGAGPA
jgi:cobalt-zinc-cadmium resistance protein CzcA